MVGKFPSCHETKAPGLPVLRNWRLGIALPGHMILRYGKYTSGLEFSEDLGKLLKRTTIDWRQAMRLGLFYWYLDRRSL
jgi:hypothetical protein